MPFPTTGLTAQDFNFGAAPAPFLSGPDMSSFISPLPDFSVGASVPGGGTGLGFNMGTANLALGGLQMLGNLWGAFQAAKLAKKQFNFTKDVTNTNLANQIKSYNTAISDRARSRGVMEGQSPDQVSQYITANALSRDAGKKGSTSGSLSDITAAALSNYKAPPRDPDAVH
jgi:hypothetical protein